MYQIGTYALKLFRKKMDQVVPFLYKAEHITHNVLNKTKHIREEDLTNEKRDFLFNKIFKNGEKNSINIVMKQNQKLKQYLHFCKSGLFTCVT